jgi:hypothetical protein
VADILAIFDPAAIKNGYPALAVKDHAMAAKGVSSLENVKNETVDLVSTCLLISPRCDVIEFHLFSPVWPCGREDCITFDLTFT